MICYIGSYIYYIYITALGSSSSRSELCGEKNSRPRSECLSPPAAAGLICLVFVWLVLVERDTDGPMIGLNHVNEYSSTVCCLMVILLT